MGRRTIVVDLDAEVVEVRDGEDVVRYAFSDAAAFGAVSEAWLRIGWDNKYVYGFTWLGRPVIQLPEDLVRVQEAVYAVKPDVIIETGVAHGGGLVFYAGLCRAMGRGRVIGVERDLRAHNRAALQRHELYDLITLVDGDSIAPETIAKVRALVREREVVMVVLDSYHAKDHVLAELRAYAPLITPQSYIVACDGIMHRLAGAPRSRPEWAWDNPKAAVEEFAAGRSDFVVSDPPQAFNEGSVTEPVTYWPGGWLRRVG